MISAFIKSMRGGDANAALYYLARMLAGGEDPQFVARRLIVFASEDIGVATSFSPSLCFFFISQSSKLCLRFSISKPCLHDFARYSLNPLS